MFSAIKRRVTNGFSGPTQFYGHVRRCRLTPLLQADKYGPNNTSGEYYNIVKKESDKGLFLLIFRCR